MVYIPSALSGNGQPYYLGIMHHIERWVGDFEFCLCGNVSGSKLKSGIPRPSYNSNLALFVWVALGNVEKPQGFNHHATTTDRPSFLRRFEGGRVRLYRHFAFKIDPSPPFSIKAVSDELPLTFNQTHKVEEDGEESLVSTQAMRSLVV